MELKAGSGEHTAVDKQAYDRNPFNGIESYIPGQASLRGWYPVNPFNGIESVEVSRPGS